MDDLFERMMEREHDRAIDGFYKHFMIFAAVIGLLAIVNVATGDKFWLHWVVLGWGIGIAAHAFVVFVRKPQRQAKLRALRAARKDAGPHPMSGREDQTPGETSKSGETGQPKL